MGEGAVRDIDTFAASTRDAPTGCGVYFFFAEARELLYVGKASNLRRRLADHRRAVGDDVARLRGVIPRVREVAWIECADEDGALCLEADVITALAPSANASMAREPFAYICLDDVAHDRVRLRVVDDGGATSGRTYGVFAHLGKGKASWRGVRTNAGYSAFLRLVWVAFAGAERRTRIPSRLRGSSPPVDHTTPICEVALLHDFLSGRSDRLLARLSGAISDADVPEFMRGTLLDDLGAAQRFYRLGPHALRKLRLRHKLPAGPVTREAFVAMITTDVTDAIGAFTAPVSRLTNASSRSR